MQPPVDVRAPRLQARHGDRALILIALAGLLALGWLYLLYWPMPMPGEGGHVAWEYAALTAVMWFVMMIAMMTPAIFPVVMLFDGAVRRSETASWPRTLIFISGYFAAWAAFSIAVSLLQILLIHVGFIDTMGVTREPAFATGLLAAVGLYQWLPIKAACLENCRSPIEVITQHFRPGNRGAWFMGWHHGLYCLGCCWLLMLLLFIGGVMNLAWIAVLTLLVMLEKLVDRGPWVRRAVGAGLLTVALLNWLRLTSL